MSSLIAGLPQLLAPGVMAEQRDSAQRLCEFGAAKQLESQEVEPAEVLEACRALLEDASYRDRASQLKEAIAEMPSPGAVVPVIEDFVRHSAAGAAEETE
jgi:UDP:flavonoid glycosyltransferase YjiC (YdhE family)